MSGDVLLDTNIVIALLEREPAVDNGLTLVTRDEHFSEVEGLELDRW